MGNVKITDITVITLYRLSVVVWIAKLTFAPESETVGCMGTMLLVELNLFEILS